MVNVQSRTRFNGKALGTDLQPFIEQLNLKMKKACKEKIYGKTQVIKECKLTGKQQQIKEGRGRRSGYQMTRFTILKLKYERRKNTIL